MSGSRCVSMVVCTFLSLVSLACSGSGSNTSPTPAGTAPNISTTNTMVYIGQTVTFQASGTTPITWGGDQAAVATVDGPTGKVTGAATGDETIWAQNSVARTTRLIHVLPSFAGTWSGNYTINSCQTTLDFSQFSLCSGFPSGAVLNMGLSINQTQDKVTDGSFTLGALQGTLNATSVTGNGQLPLTGLISSTSNATTTLINFGNARLDSLQSGTMTGTFDQTWGQQGGLQGTMILSCSIRAMTRTGGGPSMVTIFQRPESMSLSLEQLLQRIR